MIRPLVALAVVLGILGMLGLALRAPAAPDPGEDPQAKPRELRVMTYNIHHGSGNDACVPTAQPPSPAPNVPECSFDLQRIAGIIRASGAELVALQEVDRFWARSHVTDQRALLEAAVPGMNVCYGANLVHEPDRHSPVLHEYGTLILSRFPILECRNTLLPQTASPPREQRGLLEVLVNVRGVNLRVYDTHLDPSNDAERVAQVAAIMTRVGVFKEPTVLMGDLNAQPTRPEVLTLRTVFEDAWPKGGDGGSGHTYRAEPVKPPDSRIDYVLISPDVIVSRAEVAITVEIRLAADHYPVVADIALPRTRSR